MYSINISVLIFDSYDNSKKKTAMLRFIKSKMLILSSAVHNRPTRDGSTSV